MKFYVRRTSESEAEGPFTVEEINQMVRQKKLTFKSPAVPQTAEGLEAIRGMAAKQWLIVADIPGYEPDPAEERGCLSTALIILVVIVLLVIIGLIWLADILHRIH